VWLLDGPWWPVIVLAQGQGVQYNQIGCWIGHGGPACDSPGPGSRSTTSLVVGLVLVTKWRSRPV